MKIFLDANILIAACGNPQGGSAYLFRVAAQEQTWQLLTSAYAIAEARRNIIHKLPRAQDDFTSLIAAPSITIAYPPQSALIRIASRIVSSKDAPILAGALSSHAQWLCTFDVKHFHIDRVRKWCSQFDIRIAAPKDILVNWRNTQKSARKKP